MIEDLVAQLKADEGFRPKVYRDTVGKATIGWGRNLDDVGVSVGEAETLLWNDINITIHTLKVELPWTSQLSDARFGVLCNMTFNMGLPTLLCFTKMLAAVKSGDYEEAAKQMESSKWASEVGARAHRLALQMRLDEWRYAERG